MFWSQGFEATSIADLTETLGIGPPSLYRAFGDKATLFLEAVTAYDLAYGGFIDAALDQEPTARGAASRMLREAPDRYTRAGLPPGCLIVSGDAGTTNSDVAKLLERIRSEKAAALSSKIRNDITSGILPPEPLPDPLARFTMASLAGIANAAREGLPAGELAQVAAIALRAWPKPLPQK